LDDDELEVHLSDLKNQVDSLRMLIDSVQSDLVQKRENRIVAESAAAWLSTLWRNLSGVERDTEEAFEARRELTALLVERIPIGRDEGGARRWKSPTDSDRQKVRMVTLTPRSSSRRTPGPAPRGC
jgi:hypothetical protein